MRLRSEMWDGKMKWVRWGDEMRNWNENWDDKFISKSLFFSYLSFFLSNSREIKNILNLKRSLLSNYEKLYDQFSKSHSGWFSISFFYHFSLMILWDEIEMKMRYEKEIKMRELIDIILVISLSFFLFLIRFIINFQSSK